MRKNAFATVFLCAMSALLPPLLAAQPSSTGDEGYNNSYHLSRQGVLMYYLSVSGAAGRLKSKKGPMTMNTNVNPAPEKNLLEAFFANSSFNSDRTLCFIDVIRTANITSMQPGMRCLSWGQVIRRARLWDFCSAIWPASS
jgi:hypothetical protein